MEGLGNIDYKKLSWEKLLDYFGLTIRAEHGFRTMKISDHEQLQIFRAEIVDMAREFIRRYQEEAPAQSEQDKDSK